MQLMLQEKKGKEGQGCTRFVLKEGQAGQHVHAVDAAH